MEVDGVLAGDDVGDGRAASGFACRLAGFGFGRHCEYCIVVSMSVAWWTSETREPVLLW